MKTPKLFLLAVLAVIMTAVLALTGCGRRLKPISDVQPAIGDLIQVEALSNETTENSGWQIYHDERFNFAYPAGWQLNVGKSNQLHNSSPNYTVRLQNTDKQVVLGGAGPADYYVEQNGRQTVNTEKYADRYIVITVDIYDGYVNKDWTAFFNAAYPGIIVEHQNYSVAVRPELKAVVAKRISGVYNGQPRFFVKQGDSVFDTSLFYRGVDKLTAQKIFNTFIRGFNF